MVGIVQSLARGLRCRCPRCGRGRLYRGLYTELEQCASCGARFDWYSGEVLGFLYMSTALLTGLFVIVMLLWKPGSVWLGRAVIVPLALAAYLGTSRFRKGAALGLKMFLEERTR
jgi:uncharacterized protein (DUF983 family)